MLWSTLLKRVFEVDGFECPLAEAPPLVSAVAITQRTLTANINSDIQCAAQAPLDVYISMAVYGISSIFTP
jgi:hypothetical protein